MKKKQYNIIRIFNYLFIYSFIYLFSTQKHERKECDDYYEDVSKNAWKKMIIITIIIIIISFN